MIFTIKGRVFIGVSVFGGIIFLFYLFVYLPQVKYIESVEGQIGYENYKIVQLKKKTDQLNRLQAEYKKIQAELSLLKDNLQKGEDNFLYQLGLRGSIYNINYLEITPQSMLEEKYFYRTPVKIHLYGTYHSFGMLLSDMAKRQGSGTFTVDTVLIKERKEGEHTIEAYLTISLYKYKIFEFIEGSAETSEVRKDSEVSRAISRRER